MKEINKQVKIIKRSLWLQNPNSLWWFSTEQFLNFNFFFQMCWYPWISEGRAVLQLFQSSTKGTLPTEVLCSLKALATIRDKIFAQIGGLQPDPAGCVMWHTQMPPGPGDWSVLLSARCACACPLCSGKATSDFPNVDRSFPEPVPFTFREIGVYGGAGRGVSDSWCGCSARRSHVPNKDVRV